MINITKLIKLILNGTFFAFPGIIISRYRRISHIIIHGKFQNQVLVVHASVTSALILPRIGAAKQGNISGLMD